jgi:hypothetical protein
MGFAEDARLPDFYGPGDSKVIYVKELAAGGAQAGSASIIDRPD